MLTVINNMNEVINDKFHNSHRLEQHISTVFGGKRFEEIFAHYIKFRHKESEVHISLNNDEK